MLDDPFRSLKTALQCLLLLDLPKPCEGILRPFVAHYHLHKHRDSFLVNPITAPDAST